MVPFIDVMLVLLIIFMVTAPLISPSMIDLPSVGKAARQPDKVLHVVIGKDEVLQLRQEQRSTPCHFPNAAGRDQAGSGGQATTMAVVISADRAVKYGGGQRHGPICSVLACSVWACRSSSPLRACVRLGLHSCLALPPAQLRAPGLAKPAPPLLGGFSPQAETAGGGGRAWVRRAAWRRPGSGCRHHRPSPNPLNPVEKRPSVWTRPSATPTPELEQVEPSPTIAGR